MSQVYDIDNDPSFTTYQLPRVTARLRALVTVVLIAIPLGFIAVAEAPACPDGEQRIGLDSMCQVVQ